MKTLFCWVEYWSVDLQKRLAPGYKILELDGSFDPVDDGNMSSFSFVTLSRAVTTPSRQLFILPIGFFAQTTTRDTMFCFLFCDVSVYPDRFQSSLIYLTLLMIGAHFKSTARHSDYIIRILSLRAIFICTCIRQDKMTSRENALNLIPFRKEHTRLLSASLLSIQALANSRGYIIGFHIFFHTVFSLKELPPRFSRPLRAVQLFTFLQWLGNNHLNGFGQLTRFAIKELNPIRLMYSHWRSVKGWGRTQVHHDLQP